MSGNPKVGSTPKFIIVFLENGSAKDISGADAKHVFFKRPKGASLLRTANYFTDGKDGKIEYKALTTDLDVGGLWRIQGYVQIGSDVWPSDWGSFTVEPNIVKIIFGTGIFCGVSTATGTGSVVP